jgi:ketosteroid isomerase-like protein
MTATQLVTDLFRASDAGDFDRFRALLHRDCEWVNPIVQAHGAEEIARNVGGFMAAFPERRHDVSLVVASGDDLAVEGEWVAVHESGATVRAGFVALILVEADQVAAVRLYADTAALAAQLGGAGVPA